MLASDACYRASVCIGPMPGRVSMWVHPLQGIHIEFARVNAYYDKARYKSLIARENITRWNIARQLSDRNRSCAYMTIYRGKQAIVPKR